MDGRKRSDHGHPLEPQLLPVTAAPGTEDSGPAV